MDGGAGALEVAAFIIRIHGGVVVVGDEPHCSVHDCVDLVAILAIRGRSKSVAVYHLAAGRIGTVEAVALGTSEHDVLRIALDVSAMDDLYLLDRRADGILLLLEVGYVLLNAGASSKRDSRNYSEERAALVASRRLA